MRAAHEQRRKYNAAKAESDAVVDKATNGLDKRVTELEQNDTAE